MSTLILLSQNMNIATMKQIFVILSLALAMLTSCSEYDDSVLQKHIEDNDNLIKEIETELKRLNKEIKDLQDLANKIEAGKYIISVVKKIENGKVVGCTLRFSDGDEIEIRCGIDGVDGDNGNDGVDGDKGNDGNDGVTPQLRIDGEGYWVASYNGKDWVRIKDENDNYVKATGEDGVTPQLSIDDKGYWVVSYNGKDWNHIVDKEGNCVKATGEDGVTPQLSIDGEGYWEVSYDGEDGVRIKDENDNYVKATGEDGVTPQLRIDGEGYWVASYNGKDWVRIKDENDNYVKATGEDGENGTSFFESVEVIDGYVIITLADGTTTYSIPTAATYHKEQIAKIQSLTYLPKYADGMASVYADGDNNLRIDLEFIVSPKENVESIVEAYKEKAVTINLKTTQTATRSDRFIEMPIIEDTLTADGDTGIISLTIDANSVIDYNDGAFITGNIELAAALSIVFTINDTTQSITSDFITLIYDIDSNK